MADLTTVTRAEVAKLARRPATWVLLAAAIALSQAFGFLIPYISYRTSYRTGSSGEMTNGASPATLLASTLPDQVIVNTTAAYPVFTGALALVLGALVTGGEHASGTLKILLTQGPGCITVYLGQLIAAVIVVGAGVLVMFATSAASSALIAAIEDAPTDWAAPVDLLAGLGAGWAVMAMWVSLGVMLGALLRSMALPIGLGVVWILGVENLISAVAGTTLSALQPLRDMLPGVDAGSSISAVLPPTPGSLPRRPGHRQRRPRAPHRAGLPRRLHRPAHPGHPQTRRDLSPGRTDPVAPFPPEKESTMTKTYRPTRTNRLAARLLTRLLQAGRGPGFMRLLTVVGRRTGRSYTTPVVPVVTEHGRWLVSPYGEVNWVRNARAAGEVTLHRGQRVETFTVTELDPRQAAPVLGHYLSMRPAGWFIGAYVDASRDSSEAEMIHAAAHHPVFELQPRSARACPAHPLPSQSESPTPDACLPEGHPPRRSRTGSGSAH